MLMGYLNGLKDVSPTQVLASGLKLNDLLKPDFLAEVKSKLGKEYEDIVAADIRLILLPKLQEPTLKEDDKGIIIQVRNADFIRLEQPSPEHLKEGVVILTSNRKDKLDKVLSK